MSADIKLFQLFHLLAGRHWLLDGLWIFLSNYLIYVLAVVFAFLLFWKYRQWKARLYYIYLSLLALLISNGLAVKIIHFFYYRPRPFKALGFESLVEHLDTSAFPSSHAAALFVLAALMFFMERKYFWYFLISAVVASGARIITGVHWPLDILVGAAIGLGAVLAAKRLLPPLKIAN